MGTIHIVMQKGLPFEAKIPNAETLAFFEEAKDPEKCTNYPDVKTALDNILKTCPVLI